MAASLAQCRVACATRSWRSVRVKNAQRSKTVKVDLYHVHLWARRLKRGLGVEHSITGSLANHGYDLRLIQDDLGDCDLKHTVHYTRVAAGRFESLWR
jgi:hypothetical protein